MWLTRRTRCSQLLATPKTCSPGQRRLVYTDDHVASAVTPTAKQLAASGLWRKTKTGKGTLRAPPGDQAKVDIVSEQLCDDAIKHINPSLERHIGCDLIDLYPGVGLFSKKVHDIVQPRSHIMLEPNVETYTPFLKPLLSKPNTRLIPRPGIVWSELNKILNAEALPHQTPIDTRSGKPVPRNDTLLVIANFAFYPQARWNDRQTLGGLIIYQFLRSLRNSTIFQRYGRVRMLMWMDPKQRAALLPRSLQMRKRPAIEAELCTEWTREVVGVENDALEGPSRRWHSLDIASARAVAERMQKAGISIPPGRETTVGRLALEKPNLESEAGATTLRFREELAQLDRDFANNKFTTTDPLFLKRRKLQYRANQEDSLANQTVELLQEYQDLLVIMKAEAARGGNPDWMSPSPEVQELVDAHRKSIESMPHLNQSKWAGARDNWHVFHQEPPVMMWDRRVAEPIAGKAEEFYPNHRACLVDIQPKEIHPILRERELGHTFDIILPKLVNSVTPLDKVLDSIAPGAGEGVLASCPSILDPNQYGVPIRGLGGVWPRAMNEKQMMDMMEGWKRWPFAPSYHSLISHVPDSMGESTDEEESNSSKLSSGYDLA